jgi:hypothetical protein
VVPVKVAFSEFCARLALVRPDLVPVSTVLLIAEGLDALEATAASTAFLDVLMNVVAALKADGVKQQLGPDRAISLGVKALQHFGAPRHFVSLYLLLYEMFCIMYVALAGHLWASEYHARQPVQQGSSKTCGVCICPVVKA